MHDEPGTEIFHHPSGALSQVGCAALFLGVPMAAGVRAAWEAFEAAGAAAALTAVVVVVGLLYWFFNEDSTLTIDARTVRLSHQRHLFGVRGAVKVEWELPLSQLTEAQEITFHTPSRNGGWQTARKLHLPGSIVVEPAVLGGAHAPDTAYSRFVASLKRRLGERFEALDDFGPMGRKPAGGAPPERPTS